MRFILIVVIFAAFVACKDQNTTEENREVAATTSQTSIDEEQLLDEVQKQTINYFWDGANKDSGLAPERIHMDDIYPSDDKNVVTIGGTGFGLMAIVAGAERGFIAKDSAFVRLQKMVDFLDKADRFHGAWPHWLDGTTGKVKPFSKNDDGGDLVETAFLVQGLLTVAEYYKNGSEKEQALAAQIQRMWEEVEWDWYTQGEDVLYWHWSPNVGWKMNFPVGGYNEALVMYVLAASSPTHSISKEVYEKGWGVDGQIAKDTTMYGMRTILNHYEHNDDAPVGPLFWAHYSYLGLNPKGLTDQFGDYWKLNVNHAKIQYEYAIDNPKEFKGYGPDLWGMTSSYSMKGYAGHRPGNDLGVISPTAALSSMPYTPKESMAFLDHLYTDLDSLVGTYGPYDAFSLQEDWYLPRYLAIDQGPIPVMIENYRSGLLWDLFMKNEDVLNGLQKLGFSSPYLKTEED
ncbi:beta-glucosidase [Leeuwenhoekiella palythoae]|uniref:glucoamylase family protein n=1 Tax=Leeuwenhoekiella palythoae TaxID=573501 RepID=UPI000C58ABAB|nr:glucoamylase family protein [Leeuwenhoekiella palythoae]MBH11509.1 beta-glucosidase [Leeuwenhoekiella sp.]UBZ08877.1 beta-glucosidase [Leeuwenhoekiella palythoae]